MGLVDTSPLPSPQGEGGKENEVKNVRKLHNRINNKRLL